MEFVIEKGGILRMKTGKKKQKKELNCQMRKASERLERRKIKNTWENWKWKPSKRKWWNEKSENISEEQENSSKRVLRQTEE